MTPISTKKRLFKSVKFLIDETQSFVVGSVNAMMILTYFEIGRMIVEEEQRGSRRADYAKQIIENLSVFLTAEFGRGYSTTNLEYARKFYLMYQKRISQSVIGKSDLPKLATAIARKFKLSWTHYIQLLKIENSNERNFYEIESFENNWSVREFQRQYESALFERLALSREQNKTVVEITLPKDNNQIFAKQYKLYLQSKEQLIKQISS